MAQFTGGQNYGVAYGKNDVITMTYNPYYKQLLLFAVNDEEQGIIDNVYGDENLKYIDFLLI